MASFVFEGNWGNEISCLKVPQDNRHLILIGYDDGVIEIRDIQTLNKVLYTYDRSQLQKKILDVHLIYD
jgi:hypothetical protein